MKKEFNNVDCKTIKELRKNRRAIVWEFVKKEVPFKETFVEYVKFVFGKAKCKFSSH